VFDVNDQHILVTGASSGFGRHFARFLASNGAKITLAARVPIRWQRQLMKSTRLAAVCTENLIRVDDAMEPPKLAE